MRHWPILASVTRVYHTDLNKTLYKDITFGDIKAQAIDFNMDVINDLDYNTIIVTAGTPCKIISSTITENIFIEVVLDTINPKYDLNNHIYISLDSYVKFCVPIWAVH